MEVLISQPQGGSKRQHLKASFECEKRPLEVGTTLGQIPTFLQSRPSSQKFKFSTVEDLSITLLSLSHISLLPQFLRSPSKTTKIVYSSSKPIEIQSWSAETENGGGGGSRRRHRDLDRWVVWVFGSSVLRFHESRVRGGHARGRALVRHCYLLRSFSYASSSLKIFSCLWNQIAGYLQWLCIRVARKVFSCWNRSVWIEGIDLWMRWRIVFSSILVSSLLYLFDFYISWIDRICEDGVDNVISSFVDFPG